MNTAETMRMLTDKDPATGDYRIPRIIYSDAYYSETVAYADLVLPDTTYLERWDCISLLDRPIGGADGPGDAIRQPVLTPDRDVRPFQDVLIDLGARLGLPGFVNAGRAGRAIPAAMPTTSSITSARPGIGPLAGWRGADGDASGHGRAQPGPARRATSPMAASGSTSLPAEQRYFKHANRAYLEFAAAMGFIDRRRADRAAALCRAAAALPPGRAGPRRDRAARRATASGSRPISIRCRSGTCRSRRRAVDRDAFPLHAITQRPMHMYHSWGSQNAWLRQILGQQPAVHQPRGRPRARPRRRRLGVGRQPPRPGQGADPADGRGQPGHGLDLERASASAPAPGTSIADAPEFRAGFLLNQ